MADTDATLTGLARSETRASSQPWWLPRLSVVGFLAAWTVFDLIIVGVTGILSSWLRFGSIEISGARGFTILLAMVVAWFAFKHVSLHDLGNAPRPLTQLRKATGAIFIT